MDPKEIKKEEGHWEYAGKELEELLGDKYPIDPEMLAVIFSDPEKRERFYELADSGSSIADLLAEEKANAQEEHNSIELVGDGLKAFWQWAGNGFGVVEPEVYHHRISTCEACPFLGEKGTSVAHRVANAMVKDKRVCTSCGCFIRKKAKLQVGTCPEEDYDNPGHSRWGDPLKE